MPEFIQWKIDHVTPEGLELLGEVMNQFILWHKWDIILTARTPLVALQLHLEGVVEEGEIHDHHLLEMPWSSPLVLSWCLRCHSLHCLVASMCMRCHSPRRLVASMCMRCHNHHRLVASMCMMRCDNLHYKRNRHMHNKRPHDNKKCLQKKFMHKKVPARSQKFENCIQCTKGDPMCRS